RRTAVPPNLCSGIIRRIGNRVLELLRTRAISIWRRRGTLRSYGITIWTESSFLNIARPSGLLVRKGLRLGFRGFPSPTYFSIPSSLPSTLAGYVLLRLIKLRARGGVLHARTGPSRLPRISIGRAHV